MTLEVIVLYRLVYIFIIILFLHSVLEIAFYKKTEDDIPETYRGIVWSFILHLPILMLYRYDNFYIVYSLSIMIHAAMNVYIHSLKTDLKAIPYVVEQIFYIFQIIIIVFMFGALSIYYTSVS